MAFKHLVFELVCADCDRDLTADVQFMSFDRVQITLRDFDRWHEKASAAGSGLAYLEPLCETCASKYRKEDLG